MLSWCADERARKRAHEGLLRLIGQLCSEKTTETSFVGRDQKNNNNQTPRRSEAGASYEWMSCRKPPKGFLCGGRFLEEGGGCLTSGGFMGVCTFRRRTSGALLPFPTFLPSPSLLQGKYVVLFFYPLDFAWIPTGRLLSLAACQESFFLVASRLMPLILLHRLPQVSFLPRKSWPLLLVFTIPRDPLTYAVKRLAWLRCLRLRMMMAGFCTISPGSICVRGSRGKTHISTRKGSTTNIFCTSNTPSHRHAQGYFTTTGLTPKQ